MRQKLHEWFNSLILQKLFNKVIMISSGILITMLFLLAYVLDSAMSNQTEQRLTEVNDNMVADVSDYITSQQQLTSSITQQLYMDTVLYQDVTRFLTLPYAQYLEERLRAFASDNSSVANNNILRFVTQSLERHRDIDAIAFQSTKNNQLYIQQQYQQKILHAPSEQLKGPFLTNRPTDFIPSDELGLPEQQYLLYHLPINEKINNEMVGSMFVLFSKSEFATLHEEYDSRLKNELYIYAPSGDLSYTTRSKAPSLSETQLLGLSDDSITSIQTLSGSGIVVAGVVPKDIIVDALAPTRIRTYGVAVILSILAILLTFIIIRRYSKRTEQIVKAMREVQRGNLNSRIETKGDHDELDWIASSFNLMLNDLQKYVKQVYIAEIKQKEAELVALQSQISPHFLYNTLEAIRMKAVAQGAKDAGEMMYLMSNLLKRSLKQRMHITLREELDNCQTYLDLFQFRYQGRIDYTIDASAEALLCMTFKLSLQPIVENYVLHGFDPSRRDNRLTITAVIIDNRYVNIDVEDNGRGIERDTLKALRSQLKHGGPSESLGLANIQERIQAMHGSEYGLSVESQPGVKTCINIQWPVQKE
ncbi:sensor histidine kinase [Bacillaceae bacterium SIJ1]|uniref:sensor histidine kinase n=1 Tax=Litoribacterium kuwaitense TaxID=1398745 RepID=UPI0013ECE0BE|nr:sensor histidine kinase [Litoribacterium kuwaitense]NGP46611.1 sensor histidine kinase [Litoribacterium kuwaitense]